MTKQNQPSARRPIQRHLGAAVIFQHLGAAIKFGLVIADKPRAQRPALIVHYIIVHLHYPLVFAMNSRSKMHNSF